VFWKEKTKRKKKITKLKRGWDNKDEKKETAWGLEKKNKGRQKCSEMTLTPKTRGGKGKEN